MDDNGLRESWNWMDEDLRLGVGSPPAMPDCIWDDLVDNEAVVRSLFPSSPLTSHLKDSDLILSLEQQESPDCNPTPLKRRRLLESNEDILMDISACLSEPQEINSDFVVEVCEDPQSVNPSSGSLWFMTNEESLSSVDDVVEQSSESWKVGCISDSDANDVQELVHCQGNPLIHARAFKDMADNSSGSIQQTMHAMSSAASNVVRKNQHLAKSKLLPSPGIARNKKSQQDIVLKSAHLKESISLQSSKECSGWGQCPCPMSVLAYPFALVKPIGIPGDITLQDINQRINSSPSRASKTYSEQPKSTSSSPYSGKSVLALTKIYTEGNGTITIMRTKG